MKPLLLLLVIALAACTAGLDYRRPKIDAPADWSANLAAAGDGADIAWWEQFQDPALTALVAQALRDNKDVRVATARVEQAYARYGITRAAQSPRVDAGASAARARLSETAVPAAAGGRRIRRSTPYTAAQPLEPRLHQTVMKDSKLARRRVRMVAWFDILSP